MKFLIDFDTKIFYLSNDSHKTVPFFSHFFIEKHFKSTFITTDFCEIYAIFFCRYETLFEREFFEII